MANQVKSKYERTRMRYDNVQKAKVKSQLENKQRQLVNKSHTFDWIILAYLAIAGHEHYDACIKPAIAGRTQLQNSPHCHHLSLKSQTGRNIVFSLGADMLVSFS
jgi:hypothetical protein